jgi:hypothetical protein
MTAHRAPATTQTTNAPHNNQDLKSRCRAPEAQNRRLSPSSDGVPERQHEVSSSNAFD